MAIANWRGRQGPLRHKDCRSAACYFLQHIARLSLTQLHRAADAAILSGVDHAYGWSRSFDHPYSLYVLLTDGALLRSPARWWACSAPAPSNLRHQCSQPWVPLPFAAFLFALFFVAMFGFNFGLRYLKPRRRPLRPPGQAMRAAETRSSSCRTLGVLSLLVSPCVSRPRWLTPRCSIISASQPGGGLQYSPSFQALGTPLGGCSGAGGALLKREPG